MPITQKWDRALPSREFLLPLFLVLFALLPISLTIIVGAMIWPRPELITLGAVQDFSETPRQFSFNTRDGAGITIWVVQTRRGWRAFDGQVRFGAMKCFFGWQPVTDRFEDPCSGAKFARTGEYLDILAPYPYWLARNLDEYRIFVENGKLIVNVSHRIEGAPAQKLKEPPAE